MAAHGFQLLVDFRLAGAGGGHLDFHRLVGGQLVLRLHLNLEGELVGLPLLGHLVGGEGGLAHGEQLLSLDGERIALVYQAFGNGGRHRFGAQGVVNHLAGGLALAKAREVVAAGEVAVGFIDALVHFFGAHRNGDLYAVVLKRLFVRLHRSPPSCLFNSAR